MQPPWPPDPRVFTIPASAPFLPTLIDALMDGPAGARASRPAAIRWRSPARRSICRRGAPAGWRATIFLDVLKRDAAILPRIVPIGDIDEDEIAFAEAATGATADAALDLPAALDGLERARAARAADPEMGASAAMRGDGDRARWSPTARPPRWRWPTISRA